MRPPADGAAAADGRSATSQRQIPDPALRAKVTPDYTIGCKRILLSSDYYPALTRPNVDLVTDRITEITETGLVVAPTAARYDVDVIIYGTGFKTTDALTAAERGRDATASSSRMSGADGIEAYHGITVAGFPNFFLLLGPNTGLGHNSVVFMIESQVQHVLSCLRLLAKERRRRSRSGRPRSAASTTGSSAGCAGRVERGRLQELVPGRPRRQPHAVARLHLRVLGAHQARGRADYVIR